ncbi:hypothetical protein ACJ72_07278 [Emergomyces africanus]|uniref:RlpA-like protein double-psi beta-barrel domain-containing protein n=1 Tax=Emergomyces africanus TaxID=1955775 RepID=A0A1B7NNM1_9EURO|nr:hypothetical protein ACJ72_07278 [Emergomyces africanus]
MPSSISSSISSLARTISSTSIHSLRDDHLHPSADRSAPSIPQPEPATIKHVKTGSAQVSVTETPRRKPIAIPAATTTTTTTITAIPYRDSPSAEDGTDGGASPPGRTFFDKLKRPFAQLSTASWRPHAPPSSSSSSSSPHIRKLKDKLPFQSNKKKQRIFLGAIASLILLHLILIIALAVGLSNKDALPYSNLPLPTAHGGPYTGDLTYYTPGLGACGIDSNDSESVCAVSWQLYDAVSTGTDPNANPLCGKKLRLRKGDRSVDVTVVDRCVDCKLNDIDVSPSVFERLDSQEHGRVDVQWAWLEDTPLPRQPM